MAKRTLTIGHLQENSFLGPTGVMSKLIAISIFFMPVVGFDDNYYHYRISSELDHIINEETRNYTGFDRFGPTTCEVPEDNVHSDKICNFRNGFFRENAFGWWSSFGCYVYMQPSLVNASAVPLDLRSCLYRGESVRCVLLANSSGRLGCYPFDIRFPEVISILKEQFSTLVGLDKWKRCSLAARECCTLNAGDAVHQDNNTCPATWDGWSCWTPTASDSVSKNVCPDFSYSNSGPTCHHFNSKICYPNGTWNEYTDYSTCSITPRLIRRNYVHIAALSVSLAASLPAIFVFFFYKKLRVTRVALHRNLLIAIVCRNTLVIISRSQIILDELTSASGDTSMSRNDWPCKLLATLEKLASNATFVCMLVDGIYLHRLIVAVFKKGPNIKVIHGLGACIAVIPVIIWASLMGTMNDSNCWVVYELYGIQWVLDAPRIIILIINTILLIDILRVLLTKLRKQENAHQLSTTKATLFLMPLFGVQFLLTAWRPNTTSCIWEQTFYVFTYVMEGSQGFMVAILYCYFNKEVRGLIKGTYKKTEGAVMLKVRKSSANVRTRWSQSALRRTTFTTTLDNYAEETNDETEREKIDNYYQPSLDDKGVCDGQNSSQITSKEDAEVNSAAVGFINVAFTDGEVNNSNVNDTYESRSTLKLDHQGSEDIKEGSKTNPQSDDANIIMDPGTNRYLISDEFTAEMEQFEAAFASRSSAENETDVKLDVNTIFRNRSDNAGIIILNE